MMNATRYQPPDFTAPHLVAAPPARTAAVTQDGVLPDGFFATTNLPTYVKGTDGRWTLPREPRMDGVLVRDAEGGWWVREGRRVRIGDAVVVGAAEDGREGVLVHAHGFVGAAGPGGDFHFMSSQVSREKPIDYAVGTTLGMTSQGEPTPGGHAAHMRAINAVRRAGSIAAAVREGTITDGIMHACVVEEVPFVLGGSIRDDGPLPDVFTDVVAAQTATRAHTVKATMAVMIATALHSIAVGNMLPAYYEDPQRGLCELPTICVDASEFLVGKLKDRGTHQAVGVVTNAQDFMSILRAAVEREVTG